MEVWRALVFVVCVATTVRGQSQGQGRGQGQGQGNNGANPGYCCMAKIMDSTGEPLLEARAEPLDEGFYDEVRIRVCSADQTYVQLWEAVEIDNSRPGLNVTYQLAWQIEAPKPIFSQEFIPVRINPPVFIKKSYRVGVHTVIAPNSDIKVAIPYTFTLDKPPLYKAQRAYSLGELRPGVRASFDPLVWPRAFYPDHIRFCNTNTSFCAQNPDRNIIVTQGPPGQEGRQGPPGPPGPRGPPGSFPDVDPSDPNYPLWSCDDPEGLQESVNEVRTTSNDIVRELQQLRDQINLVGGDRPNLRTGACPPSWASGPYGTGYCYKVFTERVSFAEASLRCLTGEPGMNEGASLLVSIDNTLEDDFLTSLVLQTFDPEELERDGEWALWTAGMYNIEDKIWLWYYQRAWQYKQGGLESPQVGYTNWAPGEPPARPDAKREICLLLRVRNLLGVKESSWVSSDCRRANHFICKAPKQCY